MNLGALFDEYIRVFAYLNVSIYLGLGGKPNQVDQKFKIQFNSRKTCLYLINYLLNKWVQFNFSANNSKKKYNYDMRACRSNESFY
jgi:hypothetical protein